MISKKIIHARAEHYLEDIVSMKFSDDFKIFAEKIDEDTSFARKVVKVCKHSAVLEKEISTIDLIDFVKNNDYYKESLRFNEDETLFKLNSISRCKKFLELLDDDFLTSKLTNEDYIARSKDRVK
ncbi:Kiwa anti-phage protein KwaB-like domain-containing protein [Shewanella xiamenensis]|uniref:Kiwa anti-phage protein KwaB-like domain-containing protein n=1 Tax=Shewanella xiamenensis TaxID=332186 RepID=UPI002E7C243E|nr:Kiwa anti-phage protein KwaB-like domain-containing protein [Shewanella xiamenensis]MEE1979010.1 Kiwa anti-phage protein KwaB-like domain-containing protein [Shewanella xiamenensis]